MESTKQRYITANGLDKLRMFLSERGADKEDIRIEIYDHYATKMESLLNKDKGMDWQTALNKTHKDLGGDKALKKLVKSKRKQIRRYWNKRVHSFMLSYLTFPKIMLTLFVMAALFTIAMNIESEQYTIIAILIIEVIAMMIGVILYNRAVKMTFPIGHNGFRLYTYECFTNIASPASFALFIINIQQLIMNIWEGQSWVYPTFLTLGILGTTYFAVKAHAFHTQFKYWMKEELENKYPEHLELIKF